VGLLAPAAADAATNPYAAHSYATASDSSDCYCIGATIQIGSYQLSDSNPGSDFVTNELWVVNSNEVGEYWDGFQWNYPWIEAGEIVGSFGGEYGANCGEQQCGPNVSQCGVDSYWCYTTTSPELFYGFLNSNGYAADALGPGQTATTGVTTPNYSDTISTPAGTQAAKNSSATWSINVGGLQGTAPEPFNEATYLQAGTETDDVSRATAASKQYLSSYTDDVGATSSQWPGSYLYPPSSGMRNCWNTNHYSVTDGTAGSAC
jgi:hypothetical protein